MDYEEILLLNLYLTYSDTYGVISRRTAAMGCLNTVDNAVLMWRMMWETMQLCRRPCVTSCTVWGIQIPGSVGFCNDCH